jgi:hypothetical protein
VKKLELKNRIRTAFPHVKARLHRVSSSTVPAAQRWQIKIEGATDAQEIHEINGWAHAANILPHLEISA